MIETFFVRSFVLICIFFSLTSIENRIDISAKSIKWSFEICVSFLILVFITLVMWFRVASILSWILLCVLVYVLMSICCLFSAKQNEYVNQPKFVQTHTQSNTSPCKYIYELIDKCGDNKKITNFQLESIIGRECRFSFTHSRLLYQKTFNIYVMV